MKKKSLKSLKLNKKCISNLEKDTTKGGTLIPTGACLSQFRICPGQCYTERIDLCYM